MILCYKIDEISEKDKRTSQYIPRSLLDFIY